jgi:CRP/FNR family transcriptional regulator, cyclic AMP receptor protein
MNQIKQLMKYASLFHGLNDAELERVANLAEEEQYNSSDVIFNQHAPGDKMYIVGSGQVEVRVADERGASQTTLFLGAGQVFGEMALLDQGKRSATVVAVQPNTTVYSFPGDRLNALCREDTKIGYLLMRNIALDLSFKIRHHNFNI